MLMYKLGTAERILQAEKKCRDRGYPAGCLEEVYQMKRFLGWPAPAAPAKGKPPSKPPWIEYIRGVADTLSSSFGITSAAEVIAQRKNVDTYIMNRYRGAQRRLMDCTEAECCKDKECAAFLVMVKIVKGRIDWDGPKTTGAMP